jgi:hypothetical protein
MFGLGMGRKQLRQIKPPRCQRKEAGKAVQVKRLISERIRRSAHGIDVVADVNADVSVNVTERGQDRPSRSTGTGPPRPPRRDDAGADGRGKETT